MPAVCEPSVETHMPAHSSRKLRSCQRLTGWAGVCGPSVLGVVKTKRGEVAPHCHAGFGAAGRVFTGRHSKAVSRAKTTWQA